MEPTPETLQAMGTSIQARAPLKRVGLPEELARFAMLLASDDSSFMQAHFRSGGSSALCCSRRFLCSGHAHRRVLDLGTGSGYQTVLLSHLVYA